METTKQLYERAKSAAGCHSDYEFARRLGISRAAASSYVHGKSFFDDDRAELIAGILGTDPGYVMACCHAERARTDRSRANWMRIAAVMAALVAPPASGAGQAGPGADNSPSRIDVMSTIRRRLAALIPAPGPGLQFA